MTTSMTDVKTALSVVPGAMIDEAVLKIPISAQTIKRVQSILGLPSSCDSIPRALGYFSMLDIEIEGHSPHVVVLTDEHIKKMPIMAS